MENSKFKIQKLKWFIITFYLLLFSSNLFAQDSTKVTDMTADTSPAAAGVFYYVESSIDKQITWGTLTSAIRDSLENNTFYTVTFIGANFNAGSNGTVTIADSLLGTGRQWFAYLNPYSATSFIGDYSNPFLRMYSKNFVLVNLDTGDSAYVYLDDQNRVVFDADIQLIDSTKSIGSSATGDQARAVWTDSVNANYDLVLYSKNRTINTYSMLSKRAEVIPVNNSTTSITVNTNVVALTNTNTASIDTIYIDADFLDGYEEEVLIYNRGTFDVVFTPDNAGNYGIELEVSGDDTLGQYDSIRLLFDANSQRWIKTGGVDIK